MRSRILCVSEGLPSVVYPSIELARRLSAAGHRLIFAGPPGAREIAEHLGLEFLPLEENRHEKFLEMDSGIGTLRRIHDLNGRRDRALDSLAVDSFLGCLRDVDPDLLLINGEMHEHIISAFATGVPIALLNTFVSIWRRPGLPPPHSMVRPGIGWWGTRVGLSMLWFALRVRKWRTAVRNTIRRIGCDRLSLLRHLARERGFDMRRETDSGHWLIPFTYRRLPVLSLHALEFEFPHRVPERVHYVGPMVLESRIDRQMSVDDAARLDAIIERRRASEGGRKLIYAAFGSVLSANPALLRRLVQVVAERPTWDLVISLSERMGLADLGRLPERVHAFSWLPQIRLLRHADVMVHHGGINTVDECVLSCVPMLVYCGFETDMAGTAARVVYHGIGRVGDPRGDDIEAIARHIDRLLGKPLYQTNLDRLRRRYAAYADDRVAEKTVEAMLDRSAETSGDGGRAI